MSDQTIYPYPPVSFPLGDNETATLSVEIHSPATGAATTVRVSTTVKPKIKDSGFAALGKGVDLRKTVTVITSAFCVDTRVQSIVIVYKINGVVILTHTNPEDEQSEPTIEFDIKFPVK